MPIPQPITRKTKVFKSGNSQAVRIPKEFQLDVDEVEITQRGDELIIKKPEAQNASVIYDILTSFPRDFMAGGRNQPPPQEREKLE